MKNKKYLLYFPVSICLLFTILCVPNIINKEYSSFSRILGNSALNNINSDLRTKILILFIFVFLPTIFCIFHKLMKNLFLKKEDTKFDEIMNLSSIACVISLFVNIISLWKLNEVQVLLNYDSSLIISINIFLIIIKIIEKRINIEKIKTTIFLSIPILFFLLFVLNFSNIIMSTYLVLIFQLLLCFLIYYSTKVVKGKLDIQALIMMLFPILNSIMLESFNILNRNNIIILNKTKYTVILFLVLILISVLAYFKNSKKSVNNNFLYVLLILSFTILFTEVPFQTTINSLDLFESANHGVSVSELLRYGEIPILQNFDAHMLSSEISGIIYGILNNDVVGAAFSPYSIYKYLFYSIIMYYLFRKIFGEEYALISVLFLPIINDASSLYYFWGFICVLSLLNSVKNNKTKDYILLCISFIITAFIRLDLGSMFILGSLISIIISKYVLKFEINLKKLVKAFMITIIPCILVYVILCIWKDINPLTRMIEFLNLSLSNENWGYASLGSNNNIKFNLYYLLIPTLLVGTYIDLMCKYKTKFIHMEKKFYLILTILFFAYFFNISRGLTRHSLAENVYQMLLSTSVLYLSIYIYINAKKNYNVFAISYFGIVLFNILIFNPTIIINNFTNLGFTKYIEFNQYKNVNIVKSDRVILSSEYSNVYGPLKQNFDKLLNEEETYIDFSNQTLLYTFLERNKPVYVNQSPGLLNGENTQLEFINQIKKNPNVVLALVPQEDNKLALVSSLDGVLNTTRYYLISEYIWNNYTLLTEINGFYIFCRNDKVKEKQKIVGNQNVNYVANNINNLGYIPYLWGKYDKKSGESNLISTIIENHDFANNNHAIFQINNSNSSLNGNYLYFTIASNTNGNLTIILKENKKEYIKNTFHVEAGTHNYSVRISSNYSWYRNNINNIEIESDIKINSLSVYIYEGDILRGE